MIRISFQVFITVYVLTQAYECVCVEREGRECGRGKGGVSRFFYLLFWGEVVWVFLPN